MKNSKFNTLYKDLLDQYQFSILDNKQLVKDQEVENFVANNKNELIINMKTNLVYLIENCTELIVTDIKWFKNSISENTFIIYKNQFLDNIIVDKSFITIEDIINAVISILEEKYHLAIIDNIGSITIRLKNGIHYTIDTSQYDEMNENIPFIIRKN